MTRKKTLENSKSLRLQGRRDAIPWKYCLLTLACGLILVVGFFFAARQHFSSIDFGIKNSRLRKQIENLESDKRRFMLAKEIALSPAEIKKAAQKLGFREMSASNIEVYNPANDAKEKSKQNSTSEIPDAKKAETKKAEIKKEDKKSEPPTNKVTGKTLETKEKSKPQIAKK